MIPKKILMTAIVISIVGHMAIIAVSSMIDVFRSPLMDRAFTVHLEDQSKQIDNRERPHFTSSPDGTAQNKAEKSEDTVELGDKKTKYYEYLKHLKKKIEQLWSYPMDAYARKEKGTSIIRFSITDGGTLSDACILASSGYDALDREALRVIRSVGTFTPLPAKFNISRLHIIAKFHYSLAE